MSQFAFLRAEWPDLHDAATEAEAEAEALAYPDARSACFHARRALELAVHWLYKHDAALKLPYEDNLSALNLRNLANRYGGCCVHPRNEGGSGHSSGRNIESARSSRP